MVNESLLRRLSDGEVNNIILAAGLPRADGQIKTTLVICATASKSASNRASSWR